MISARARDLGLLYGRGLSCMKISSTWQEHSMTVSSLHWTMEMSRNVLIKVHAVADYFGGRRKMGLAKFSKRIQVSPSKTIIWIVQCLILSKPDWNYFSHIKGSSQDDDSDGWGDYSCERVTKDDRVEKRKCWEKLRVVCGRKWINQFVELQLWGYNKLCSTAKTLDPTSTCSTSGTCPTQWGNVPYQGRCSNVCGDKTHWMCEDRCSQFSLMYITVFRTSIILCEWLCYFHCIQTDTFQVLPSSPN